MILPGQMIRMRGIFSPFCERQVSHGMSYGLSCAGYDVRLKNDVTLVQGYTMVTSVLDHIDMPPDLLGMVADKSTWARRGVQVQHTVIEPGWRGTLAIELTYQPVLTNNELDTILINIEYTEKYIAKQNSIPPFTGSSFFVPETIKIEAGTPIAQVVIHQLMAPAEAPYKGKYQNQEAGDVMAKFEKPEGFQNMFSSPKPGEISEENTELDKWKTLAENTVRLPLEEEFFERKIYEGEVTPVKRDMAGVLMRNGLWVNWDEDRQTWLGRTKDVEKIKEQGN